MRTDTNEARELSVTFEMLDASHEYETTLCTHGAVPGNIMKAVRSDQVPLHL